MDQLLAKAKVQTASRYYAVWHYASHIPLGLLKRSTSYVSPTPDKSAAENLKDTVCLRVSIGYKMQVFFCLCFEKAKLWAASMKAFALFELIIASGIKW